MKGSPRSLFLSMANRAAGAWTSAATAAIKRQQRIRERLGGSAEGPFGVDHPGGGAQVGHESVEPHGLGQTGLITEEPQNARVERVSASSGSSGSSASRLAAAP